MTGTGNQNPFAPPRALVEDLGEPGGAMADATRGSRFAAVLIDGLGPVIIIGFTLAAVAIPAYTRYKQKAAGIASTHSAAPMEGMGILAVLLSLAMLGYFIYS